MQRMDASNKRKIKMQTSAICMNKIEKKYPIETLNESHALKVKTSYVCDFFFAFSFIFTFLLLMCIHSNFAAAVVLHFSQFCFNTGEKRTYMHVCVCVCMIQSSDNIT